VVAAISGHFGVDAETLERALEPTNMAVLSSAREAELASFLNNHPGNFSRRQSNEREARKRAVALAEELVTELEGEVKH
jgi:hypothetical protein